MYHYKFDLIIEILNLFWLLALCTPGDSSFIWSQFYVLNSDGWFVVSFIKSIIFWYSFIILINQSWLINYLLSFFWRYMSFFRYFSIKFSIFIFICNCFWIILWWILKYSKSFVILLAILLSIKSPVPSAVLWIALFKRVLSLSVADCLAWSRSF